MVKYKIDYVGTNIIEIENIPNLKKDIKLYLGKYLLVEKEKNILPNNRAIKKIIKDK